ncbi:MAG: GWxTD domain-containing protein [Bacteroidia bacterium]|nr:GWxTD domain-containing protein [Bacteroidia bacterium]
MNRISILIWVMWLGFAGGFCSLAKAGGVDYAVDVFAFRDAKGQPYLEVHTKIDAATLAYSAIQGGGYQGEVDVLIFLQEAGVETGAEANALRVNLKTPVVKDTARANLVQLLVDVRKIPAEEGKYTLTGFLKDKGDAAQKEYSFERELVINPPAENGLSFSNVLFLDKFERTKDKLPYSRYGFDVLTRIPDNYYENKDSLLFYVELYNVPGLDANENYFLHTYITQANDTEKLEKYKRTVKKKCAKLDLYSASFDISDLPSQTYFLNFELYSQQSQLVGTLSKKFYVINDKFSVDYSQSADAFERIFGIAESDLDKYIPALAYISTNTEKDFVKSLNTFEEKKNYFLTFWEKRKEEEADSPARPWMEYKARMDYANENYRSFKVPGWKTDRGRVILTYGPPNNVDYYPMGEWRYPYEIWTYNRLRIQNNVKFVFWDVDLATNSYPLLHSDLRGEVNNPRWKLDLLRRTAQDGNMDNVDEMGNTRER